jgi:GNAT superfamily N-acetyltransferase
MHIVITDAVEQDLQAAMIENVDANVGVWLKRPGDCVHLVATAQDQVVGVILVKDFWNLCSLFVAKSHRGNGIGRALVAEALALCKGRSSKGALLLNAAPSAVAFYEHLGFTPWQSQQAMPRGITPMRLAL